MPDNNDQIKIAVCGHIDHGKSTLIGRLLLDTKSLPNDKLNELRVIAKNFGEETQLAHLSDQLKEERERNITIETTQVFFKTRKRSYCMIDTPGHLEFIRNMLTGSSQADAALLIIDIKEGIQNQTRRHAYLLNFLSLKNIIVLVNKMDLAQYSQLKFQKVKTELLSLFSDLKIQPLHIIPICAKLGKNISRPTKQMSWYRGPCLIEAIDQLAANKKSTNQNLRLPVQDVYTHNNERIIVGRIASGVVRARQEILILPQTKTATVEAIKIFAKKQNHATADESIGLTLTTDIAVQRGDILCTKSEAFSEPKYFQGNIFWLSPTALVQGQTITLQCATQTLNCSVTKILTAIDPADSTAIEKNVTTLKKNQAALIEFTLLTPAVLERHSDVPELGRFTIEDNCELLGAGTILTIARS